MLLDSGAARSCPVKTQNAYLPGLRQPERMLDPAVLTRRAAERDRRHLLLDDWLARTPGAVDLRGAAADPLEHRVAAALAAMGSGAPLVVGATLPPDPDGGRVGAPDALVRARGREGDRGGGSAAEPAYLPVIIKGHHVITTDPPHHGPEPTRSDGEPQGADRSTTETSEAQERPTLIYGTFDDPAPAAERTMSGRRLKTGSRTGDFLQLAHYLRLLAAAGRRPAGPAWGGVIGTDEPITPPGRGVPEPVIGWLDLDDPMPPWGRAAGAAADREPAAPTLSNPSFLQRYDAEHSFRLHVADTARRQGRPDHPPLLVEPVVNAECSTCAWWAVCRPQLDDDDLSLRIERGRLWPREVLALRGLGLGTVPALAAASLDELTTELDARLGERPGAGARLRTAVRRARMLVGGEDFVRETTGPIELPRADREIDFDLETAADGRIYLWGFRVDDGTGHPECRQFARFDDLDEAGELDLARSALRWLRDQVQAAAVGGTDSVRVYHYSGFEVMRLRQLADRSGDPLTIWAAEYAEHEFVDLLEVAKTHYFGVAGLGLKAIARHAGFRWRDSDPGGLNSQCWFDEAVHGAPDRRAQARRRVLEYNEDDVIATSRLRDWLRAQ